MITTSNYFHKIKEIDKSRLPAKLKEGYDFVKELTENHTTWDYYNSDKDIKATVDEYLANLSDYASGKQEPKKLSEKQTGKNKDNEKLARDAAKKLIRGYVERGDSVDELKKSMTGYAGNGYSAMIRGNKIIIDKLEGKEVDFSFPLQSIYNDILEELPAKKTVPINTKPKKQKQSSPTKTAHVRVTTNNAKPVERVDDSVRFIKRYALLHGKEKTDEQILHFINALQKAILEKRIRKNSTHAKEITYIQDNLIKLYNTMGSKTEIKVNDKVLKNFLEIAGSQKVRLSVNYLKRYIGIQGKHINKEKAKKLIDLMKKAVKKGQVTKSDPHANKLDNVYLSLQKFIDVAGKNDTLEVHKSVLEGIHEALDGCACCEKKRHGKTEGLLGIEELPFQPALGDRKDSSIMNSVDFARLSFDTLGFMGKWKDLIGDPAEGFTAMVYGPPKFGKSYLCIEWAGYLARHHGNTLYVAKEEKLHNTLQKKLIEKDALHPGLTVSSYLPDDISAYQFIFLDSVSKLGLTPADLESLKAGNPGKSFIYVFHTTKGGKFRGENTFQHDVDVVIEVPEKGKAIQFGRFNQGGEMEIFEAA
jgi:hypothetical protein